MLLGLAAELVGYPKGDLGLGRVRRHAADGSLLRIDGEPCRTGQQVEMVAFAIPELQGRSFSRAMLDIAQRGQHSRGVRETTSCGNRIGGTAPEAWVRQFRIVRGDALDAMFVYGDHPVVAAILVGMGWRRCQHHHRGSRGFAQQVGRDAATLKGLIGLVVHGEALFIRAVDLVGHRSFSLPVGGPVQNHGFAAFFQAQIDGYGRSGPAEGLGGRPGAPYPPRRTRTQAPIIGHSRTEHAPEGDAPGRGAKNHVIIGTVRHLEVGSQAHLQMGGLGSGGRFPGKGDKGAAHQGIGSGREGFRRCRRAGIVAFPPAMCDADASRLAIAIRVDDPVDAEAQARQRQRGAHHVAHHMQTAQNRAVRTGGTAQAEANPIPVFCWRPVRVQSLVDRYLGGYFSRAPSAPHDAFLASGSLDGHEEAIIGGFSLEFGPETSPGDNPGRRNDTGQCRVGALARQARRRAGKRNDGGIIHSFGGKGPQGHRGIVDQFGIAEIGGTMLPFGTVADVFADIVPAQFDAFAGSQGVLHGMAADEMAVFLVIRSEKGRIAFAAVPAAEFRSVVQFPANEIMIAGTGVAADEAAVFPIPMKYAFIEIDEGEGAIDHGFGLDVAMQGPDERIFRIGGFAQAGGAKQRCAAISQVVAEIQSVAIQQFDRIMEFVIGKQRGAMVARLAHMFPEIKGFVELRIGPGGEFRDDFFERAPAAAFIDHQARPAHRSIADIGDGEGDIGLKGHLETVVATTAAVFEIDGSPHGDRVAVRRRGDDLAVFADAVFAAERPFEFGVDRRGRHRVAAAIRARIGIVARAHVEHVLRPVRVTPFSQLADVRMHRAGRSKRFTVLEQ